MKTNGKWPPPPNGKAKSKKASLIVCFVQLQLITVPHNAPLMFVPVVVRKVTGYILVLTKSVIAAI